MIKKMLFMVAVLLVVSNGYAMDLEVTKLSPEQDYKCYWVARYVYKCFNKLDTDQTKKLDQFFKNRSILSNKVTEYCQNMQNSDKQVEIFLKKFLDQTIDEAYEAYVTLPIGTQYQITFCLSRTPLGTFLEGDINKDTVKDVLIDSSFCKDIEIEGGIKKDEVTCDHLGIFQRKRDDQGDQKVQRKIKKNDIADFTKVLQIYPIWGLLYLMSQKDFVLHFSKNHYGAIEQNVVITPSVGFIAHLQWENVFPLLQKICKGSQASFVKDIDFHCRLSQEEVSALRTFHTKVSDFPEWKELQNALIGIHFQQPTLSQRFKDRALLAIPLVLVEAVIPELSYRFMSGNMIPFFIMGKTTSALGILLCGITSSLVVGNRLFPFLDKYNSGVGQLKDIFGEIGVRRMLKPGFSFENSMLHYCAVAMGMYCLSAGGSVIPMVGVTIYGLRLLALLYGILSTKQYEGDCSCFGKMAFAHPGLRRKKNGSRFRLKDLINPT